MNKKKITLCPCCSGKTYPLCCEPYHLWQKNAETAEILMRSRYSAYALHNAEYLIKTWHPETLPDQLSEEISNAKWIDLYIHRSWQEENPDEAFVLFTARYRDRGGKAKRMNEISRFIRQDQHWFYIDGKFV